MSVVAKAAGAAVSGKDVDTQPDAAGGLDFYTGKLEKRKGSDG